MIGRAARAVAVVALLAAAALGGLACGSSGPSAAPSAPSAAQGSPNVSAQPSTTPQVGDPPIGSIQVEGGDPVVGQLGTYSWAGGGSSSPWLPGAPIAVGAQETLQVTVEPGTVVTDWTARIAPADDQDGAQAAVIASGVGAPVLGAPKRGSWTLAVTVTYGELGSATYAWRLDVS